ncbi:MAG: Ig-like domain-containing protein [Limisphaerales bacterium]
MQNLSTLVALLAASLLAPAAAQAAAAPRPVLIITYPTVNLSVTNPVITVSGKASDKTGVTNVFYQVNGTGWTQAATTNGWTNWTARVTLTNLGANTLQAFAVDAGTNYSLTNTVKFTFAPTAPLTVEVTGLGTVTPNYNGKWLKIGEKYTMTAKPGKGFGFVKWFGSLSTSSPTLSFVMASNLTLIARFENVTPPVAVILSPKVHQTVTTALFTVTGKASDNVEVTNVWYQFNGEGWTSASTANGWTNWTADVTLSLGTNLVQAFAEDSAGLMSKTNSVSFIYKSSAGAGLAPASLSGMMAQVTTTNDEKSFTIAFGTDSFTQTMLPGTSEDNNAVGNYTYSTLGANSALLTITYTAPPARTNHNNTVTLTFTNSQEATFTSTNGSGSTDAGSVVLSSAPNLAPASLAGDTADLVDSSNISTTTVFAADHTFTVTGTLSGSVSKGTYTFTRTSPVGGLLTLDFTSPPDVAGGVGYNIITYSAAKAGYWFQAFIPIGSTQAANDFGSFTSP